MNIYEVLDKYQISYQEVTHPKVMTVDEMKKLSIPLKGVGCKNLFLTDHKGKYFLVVLEENNKNVMLSARNIPNVKTAGVNTINVYDILKYESFVVTKEALAKIEEVYK